VIAKRAWLAAPLEPIGLERQPDVRRLAQVHERDGGEPGRPHAGQGRAGEDLHTGADPAGDYAWAIFDRIDAMRPGFGEVLRPKAQSVLNATVPAASPGQSPTAALFAANQIDLSITYCSAAGALEKERPELASLPVPPELDPHPVFGLAVLSTNPSAMRLALYLLSEKGQAIVAKNGLLPLLDAPR
jgi:hypothetical protein